MAIRPVRVGFSMIPRRAWAGGYNYLLNLFTALHRHHPGEITPVVFHGQDTDLGELADFADKGVEIVSSKAWGRRNAGLFEALLLGVDRRANAEFERNQIDVVFETARFFGWGLNRPVVAWFPDMQHRRLPHLFSWRARWKRELGFRAQMGSYRLVMLSSESALRDCARFYPGMERHAAVVRFAAQPSPNLLEAEPSTVASHYDLPSNYLYLPNQFWRHKNHDVVVDALAILREQNQDVVIAVSGGADPRDPEYLAGILQKVETRGLQSRFRYLGMIPLAHVYALLRGARALVNPSRFEGWSTTIEEAKSFGVPMVLSELDVHREQTGGNALYFPANEAKVLADRLAYASQMASPGGGARALLPDVDQRVARFATDFISVIQRAADARPLP